ncbi:MAG TPA: DUF6624 domain-containing protein [Gemmataceae bacterium]|jgi:hypothetical protein|nr:DUF6624 domain-containing protein [Gemmataceae bacterium]
MTVHFQLQAGLPIAVLLFALTSLLAEEPAPKPAGLGYNSELREELQKRLKEDQAARMAIVEWMKKQQFNDPEKLKKMDDEPIVKKLLEIDHANTKWLKDVVEKHGWPCRSMVGDDGAHSAWLLVQHADKDHEFQKKCLELMKALAPKGEVARSDLAYLTDRILVAENKKQIYGTQFHNVNGKMEPVPIEDEANVDKRRQEAGLPTMAEYRQIVEKTYTQKR